ncbi:MAG: hypothetical protein WC980_04610 [Candidatus Brocadiia bacterium]
MPNFGRHAKWGFLLGGGTGLIIDLVRQFDRMKKGEQEKFSWAELLLYTGGGASLGFACATVPDWLEPATNPNHREVFHSMSAGVLTIIGLIRANQSNLPTELKDGITAGGLSMLSHLVLDSATPKGLPFIGIKM